MPQANSLILFIPLSLVLSLLICAIPARAWPPGPITPATDEDLARAELRLKADGLVVPMTPPILIEVILENRGDTLLAFTSSRERPGRTVVFTVEDHRGEAVPLTRYGEQLYRVHAIESDSKVFHRIQPGQAYRAQHALDRIYDMTMDGTYVVKAKVYVHDRSGESFVEIESEPVRLRVSRSAGAAAWERIEE